MSDTPTKNEFAGRIEGGIDAIVIGAGVNGLVAAAYLAKAGLKTVLIESAGELGGTIIEREFATGRKCVDGEHLIWRLDPKASEDLDLYRFGVSYAARRLETTYFFEDGVSLPLGGDLHSAAQSLSPEDGGGNLQRLLSEGLETAAALRPIFDADGKQAASLQNSVSNLPANWARRLDQYAFGSVDQVLGDLFADTPIKTALTSEACFRSGIAPHHSMGFLSLIHRWSGEAAGLQGAIAYPKGGVASVVNALRRCAQAAQVDIRSNTQSEKILIESDCAAGVKLGDGGQIRAPIVVSALTAQRTFQEMVGPENLDIKFQNAISRRPAPIGSARMHFVLKGVARDEGTIKNMQRRLFFAPPTESLRAAFADAKSGYVPDNLILEAIFPYAFDEEKNDEKIQLMSVFAHPLPLMEAPDKDHRKAVRDAIVRALAKFAPKIENRIEEEDLRLPADFAHGDARPGDFASPDSVLQQLSRAAATTSASRIRGLFFCGPEAQIGDGVCGVPGRNAARAAITFAKNESVGR